MAGNIVKWWKHKILGGYKQFSVQECTTDSEELMYHQVRAPSSCSAPPDLLLVSDRENNIPLKSPVVNIITATSATATTAGCSQRHHQQHQQQQQQLHQTTKELFSKNAQNTKISSSKNSSKFINMQTTATTTMQQNQQQQQQNNEANQQQQQQHQSRHHGKEEQRIHLEEFTCDVSVEGGKSTQPLQFSFTFYDLDGHHGKITKDDIVGIVYTIYESIGKSVVVPHCGSKTINVRLTVSPEGKSKATANKLKKMQPNGMPGLDNNCKANSTTATSAAVQAGHSRRQHRYRPRKLIKTDDEDDDSTSEKDLQLTAMAAAAASATASANKLKSHASKYNNRMKLEQQQQQQQQQMTTASSNCCQSTTENNRNLENNMEMSASSCQHDNNLYENVATNLKCCTTKDAKKCENSTSLTGEECRGCVGNNVTTTATTTMAGLQHKTTDMYLKQASSRVKMLRKARKQKYQDHCLETRQRSLSVGSETCWKSRYAKNSTLLMDTLTPATQQRLYQQQQQQQQQQAHGEDVVDGVQLRNPHRLAAANILSATKRSSADCWKTALNRNELISIIRESMEKNRLCFQLNGKPQASVSPIRQSQQRQRSNTVSKIPTLIANHSNSITNCNNNNSIQPQHTNNNNSSLHNKDSNMHDSHTNYQQHHQQQQQQQQHHQLQQQQQLHQQQPHQHPHPQHHPHHSHHHPQPHIPIYHQQMAINPAVLAAQNGIVHSKMNLCGYDSFLHATICGGGTSHSPPPSAPAATVAFLTTHTQQPVATVQPIMNAINAAAAAVPNMQQQYQQQQQQQQHHYQVPTPKIYAHPITTTQQIKTSKILRSGTFSQTHLHAASVAATSTPVAQHGSTQYHGYHRLASATASATKHNLAALNSQNPSMAKAQVEHLEKWLLEREQCAVSAVKSQKAKKDVKNYDNLLFAKLTEKLQDSTLNVEQSEKQKQEAGQRRKQRALYKAQKRNSIAESGAHYSSVLPKSQAQQQEMIVSPVTSEQSNYAALIPINGDPIECENLLSNQTSDEDTSAEVATPTTAAATTVKASSDKKETAATVIGDLLDFNEENVSAAVAPNATTGRDSSNSNSSGAAMVATCDVSAGNNCSNSASLIHRYVHEHIHHHYHHFEDKDE